MNIIKSINVPGKGKVAVIVIGNAIDYSIKRPLRWSQHIIDETKDLKERIISGETISNTDLLRYLNSVDWAASNAEYWLSKISES